MKALITFDHKSFVEVFDFQFTPGEKIVTKYNTFGAGSLVPINVQNNAEDDTCSFQSPFVLKPKTIASILTNGGDQFKVAIKALDETGTSDRWIATIMQQEGFDEDAFAFYYNKHVGKPL